MLGKEHFIMSRSLIFALVAVFASVSLHNLGAEEAETITFSKHIAPIFQARCVECHRTQGLASFDLQSYESARPWGKSIVKQVRDGKMPPWGLDPKVGEWKDDPTLTEEQIAMISKWVNNGMPEGDKKDLPEPRTFHDDWSIPKPDMVFEMPNEITIPADGVMPYQYHVTDLKNTEDLYVQSMEVLPGNRKVVHHIIVFLRPPAEWSRANKDGFTTDFLDVYAPGSPAGVNPPGVARLIPKGSKLMWQVHYTPTGKEEKDKSKFGIVLATEKPKELMRTVLMVNTGFKIPPMAPDHVVEGKSTIRHDATIYSFTPHMHYRGKAMEFYLTPPGGQEELVCSVPKYDFNWQLDYFLKEPRKVPAGTTVRVVGHFDNSPNNPFNPDPSKEVRWGEQTWEEMLMGGIYVSWPVAPASAPIPASSSAGGN